MLAQNSYDMVRPANGRSRHKRKTGLFSTLFSNPIICILLVAGVLCLVASVYISAYAGVQEKGYVKSDLNRKLKTIRLENDRMRLELDKLRQPEEITKFANTSKMKQNEEMAYLSPSIQPKVAQNTER